MPKLFLKVSSLSALLIFLYFQSSSITNAKNQSPIEKVIKNQGISKSLKMSHDYGKIPLYFIPNEGQVNDKTLFYARASRYTLWLTKKGLVFDRMKRVKKGESESRIVHPKNRNNPEYFTCDRNASRLIFLNSKKNPEVVPIDRTKHKVNYFIGKDKSKWRTNIQTSRAVLYKELYRNIDLKVLGIEKQIEYDFIVKPGSEVSDIKFEYRDVEKTKIDKEGNLVIETKFGEFKHAKPECYQSIGEEKVHIEARFKKIEKNTYGFEIKEYNENYELIIDPLVLVYSTYLGGSHSDAGYDIAVDSEGAAYVTGVTQSVDFPTQNPIQGTNAGYDNVFISKINVDGNALVYSTYLGGSVADYGQSIAVDSEGAAYVTGHTWSTDFPTQTPIQESYTAWHDAFITKLHLTCVLTINTGKGGTTYPSSGSYTYDYGTEVTITAISESGYSFSGWSGNASGTSNPLTITLDSDKSVTANFSAIKGEGDDDSQFELPCFIATAAYSSPLHPHVKILRDFRDKYLIPHKPGRFLVKLYYKYPPNLVGLIEKYRALKTVIRLGLMPLVALSYLMLHLGPVITAVMPGVIILLPFFVWFYSKRMKN